MRPNPNIHVLDQLAFLEIRKALLRDAIQLQVVDALHTRLYSVINRLHLIIH